MAEKKSKDDEAPRETATEVEDEIERELAKAKSETRADGSTAYFTHEKAKKREVGS